MDHARRLAQYKQATLTEPGDPANWRGLCRAAEALHVWGEVTGALDRLIAMSDDRSALARLQAKKAHVLECDVVDLPKARHHYEKALQAEPTWIWPYLALAMLDLQERRWNRAIAHANHALEIGGGEAPERPWLLLVKAIASQRVSVSMGPQSTFFRQLRGPAPATARDPGEVAFVEAKARLPELAGATPDTFLADGAAAVRFVVERCPRPALDAM